MKHLVGWLGALSACGVLAATPGCAPESTPGNGIVRVLVAEGSGDPSGDVSLRLTLRQVCLVPRPADASKSGVIEMRGGPIGIPGDLEIDLPDVRRGRSVLIASHRAPAGDYVQVRLVIASAVVVRRGAGSDGPVAMTSMGLEGTPIDVPTAFTLRDGDIHDVILDFDAAASARALEAGDPRGIVVHPAPTAAAGGTS